MGDTALKGYGAGGLEGIESTDRALNVNVINPVSGISNVTFIVDGGGSVITTGIKGDVTVPFNALIVSVTLLADQVGSIVVDLWKDILANYPPTGADSITASAKPSISTNDDSTDTTLIGWTRTIIAGDVIRYNVDSCDAITRCTVSLKVLKT